ncbi:MAG: adenylate/guanylate cyclase domain-containing protein [Elusimicrobia bacterium]|nr:adenylate/guanylate cyclase domain-containing protein [Elusimicrobiota bacterium]
MSDKKETKSRFPLIFTIVFSFIFLVLWWPQMLMIPINGVFHHIEDVWMDKMFVLRFPALKEGDPRIILAAVDEDTGRKFGFPLPRDKYADLLGKLKSYGVKTVAFDVMFFEPKPVEDKKLADATKRFGRVIHLFQSRTENTTHGDVVSVNMPVSGLDKAAQFLGYPNIDFVIDADGHVRRSVMFDLRIDDPREVGQPAASMDIACVASFTERPFQELRDIYAGPPPRLMHISFRKPKTWLQHEKRDIGQAGEVQNLPKVHSPYRMISVMDLLNGELTDEQRKALKGSLMIIGSTTLGYFDHYPSPFSPTAPGAEYHANNIDNLIHEDFLEIPTRQYMLVIIIIMIWLPLILLRFSPAVSNSAALLLLAAWFSWSWYQFGQGVRVELVAPALALLGSFIVQTAYRMVTEGAEKKKIKNLFGQFVAPEVVEDLARDPSKVKLGGERKDLTIFFLDIAHFTTISEKMSPEGLILFLNRYLSVLSKIIQDRKGVIDKYIGDCIMAFWNAPLECPDHRVQACLSAIECQEMMGELNKNLEPGLPEIPAVRIGLNSGEATVGLTGSEKKLQYTVLGDEVNLASRLEGSNKFFGSKIMASEDTYEGAKDRVEARELGRVRVVGKSEPIRVFELLAKKGGLSEEWKKALPLYEKGLGHFNKREFEPAKAAFEEFVKIFPEDGPAKLYLNVSTDYSVIPPPEEWDGVFNLTAK